VSLLEDPFHKVVARVLNERIRQEELCQSGKFAFTCVDEGISHFERLSVLAEEFGEAAHEVNESIGGRKLDLEKLRSELVQVAAVTVAWLEYLETHLAQSPTGQ
jgi:hypothetical protein